MPLKVGRVISAETCGLDDIFPPDDVGSGPCTPFIICLLLLIAVLWQWFSNRNKTSRLPLLNAGFEPGSLEPNLQQTDCPPSYRGTSKNLNSTARPHDQRAFSLLDPIAIWLSHLALAIYIFAVVNFDALTQASDFQIVRRQVVFICWMQDLNHAL